MSTPAAVTKQRQWQPPSLNDYNAQHPGWAHRFVDKRRKDRLDKFLQEGWVIAPYGKEGEEGNRPTGASSMDQAVHYRGLVLMRMPIDMARQRNKHWRDKGNRLLKAAAAVEKVAAASRSVNKTAGTPLTSAFAEATVRHAKSGTLDHSRSDTDPERAMRETNPEDVQELRERAQAQAEDNRRLAEENARLRTEQAERTRAGKRGGSKSFPK